MDKLKFSTILYFIFEHITVLKQIHTLGACHVLEHFTFLLQTHTLSTCRVWELVAYLTFLRFETVILTNFLSIFREYTRYKKKF